MVQFIHQNPKNLTLSDADRRIVRKVSNRAAAATRRAKGTTARTNTLQLPDFLVTETKAVIDPSPRAPPAQETAECIRLQQSKQVPFDQALALCRHLSPVGRPAKRSYNASIASPLPLWPNKRNSPEYLSFLMQPGLSQKLLLDASSVGVNSDPRRWVKICRLTAILQFLPRMIGHSQCLDYAIDCLAERVRQCCIQSLDRELALTQLEKRYGRALQCLQNALNSSRSIDWTVWYTTLLLTLFELLDNSGHHAWISHSQGAKHILLTLGPNKIKTEFEKILLAAQCQIMTVEATFINQDCFLSSPTWQQALQSTITHNCLLLDRSEPVLTMWMMTTRAPELYRRCTDAILQCHPPEQNARIAAELCALIKEYSEWREKWEEILVGSGNSGHDSSYTDEAALAGAGPTIYPIFLAFWALTNRFLVAIQPSRAPGAETNAINAALHIIEFDRLRETDSVIDLCRTFPASIARSIKLTTSEWSMQEHVSRTSQTIEPRIFLYWCTLLGRATK
ncbi:uncharacterized protein Z519_10946 [Cladophialophora bantiana CBS 173.52]|uniref:Transcription factor domain-containing protein n=1 Tax=Cladophialophora bantiana (strain ATCC 10958 / CBS 173.52 / CDC B-1940 / NIH 8579) TaxID=1442370 RepID=A0A0D2FNX2_CLAB1|nr:uncharacterized protein Z519_10946 [Cladophialophora bantiana CBS 173.52]KIW88377.1 hypothetical protein Z519_10946 [Cladophialophora bantiana CBS 173.52]